MTGTKRITKSTATQLMTHDEAVAAWSKTLQALSPDARIVEEILTAAFNHDAACQTIYARLYIELEKRQAPTEMLDTLGTLCYTIIAMCAGLGEGAGNRVREAGWARAALDGDTISHLPAREFLKPLFDNAGLKDNFRDESSFALQAYFKKNAASAA